MEEFIFIYEEDQNYLDNYRRWREMNSAERNAYGERPMGESEAERMFAKMVGDSWLKKKRN
jgi:hypothetical protein